MLKCAVILASLRRVCTYRNAANVEKSPANMSELCYTPRVRLKLKLDQYELTSNLLDYKGFDLYKSLYACPITIFFTFNTGNLVNLYPLVVFVIMRSKFFIHI